MFDDYFVATRYRRRGAPRERSVEGSEVGDHPQGHDNSSNGISPWDVEYRPNPVIFAHLSTHQDVLSTESTATYGPGMDMDVTAGSEPSKEYRIHYSDDDHNGLPSMTVNVVNTGISTLNLRPDGSAHSDDTLHTWRSNTDNIGEDVSPTTATSQNSFTDKGKSPCVSGVGTVELINLVAGVHPKALVGTPRDIHPLALATSPWSATGCSTESYNTKSSSDLPLPVESVRTVDSTPPSVPDVVDKDLPYPCPSCGLRFPTPGLKRYILPPSPILRGSDVYANILQQGSSAP
jgi:hypothetical protein